MSKYYIELIEYLDLVNLRRVKKSPCSNDGIADPVIVGCEISSQPRGFVSSCDFLMGGR